MSKRVQRRRGTAAEHTSGTGFTGEIGEITVDTTANTIRIHDGTTLGGHPLSRADASNLDLTNKINVNELNLADGTVGQHLTTTGAGVLIFADVPDVSATAVGGDISGTVGNAQIVANSVGVTELNVNAGSAGQALTITGAGALAFTTVVTDPTVGGDLSGTTSNAQIVANAVGAAEIATNAVSVNELNVAEGAANTYLKTDGAGNLSFAAVSGGGLNSSSWAEDTFTGNGSTTTFTLTQTANVNGKSILVYVDGVNQPLAAYTLPTTTSLSITPAVHTGGAIRVLHLGIFSSGLSSGSSNFVEDIMTGDGSATTFNFPSNQTAPSLESILVHVDGVAQPTSAYTLPTTTSIGITPAPYTGAKIRVLHLGVAGAINANTGGENSTTLVADGALPNGCPVVLNTDGTVSAVSATTVTTYATPNVKNPLSDNTHNQNRPRYCMDPNNTNKFACGYNTSDTSNHDYFVAVGTIDRTAAALDYSKTVTVAASKFVMDGVSQDALTWHNGKIYTFDISGISGHILRFSLTADGTHGGGVEYTAQVTRTATTVTIVAPDNATHGTMYYYCGTHASMGAAITNKAMISFGTPFIPYSGFLAHTDSLQYVPSSIAGYHGRFVFTGEKQPGNYSGWVFSMLVGSAGAGTTITDSGSTITTNSGERTVYNWLAMDPHHAGKFICNTSSGGGSTFFSQCNMVAGTGVITIEATVTNPAGSGTACNSLMYNPIVVGQGIWSGGTGGTMNGLVPFTVNASGQGLTVGATQSITISQSINGTPTAYFDPNPNNGGKMLVFTSNQLAGAGHTFVNVCTVSGNTLTTLGETTLCTNSFGGNHIVWDPANNGDFYLEAGRDAGNADQDRYLVPGNITGSTVTLDVAGAKGFCVGSWATDYASNQMPAVLYDLVDPAYMIIGLKDNTDGWSSKYMYAKFGMHANGGSVTTENLTDQAFIGFSNSAYTDGQTATINVSGIDDNQTGLTIGSTYYVQLDGTVGTTAASPSVKAGKAIKATEILISARG